MDLKVSIEGVLREVCGVTDTTTCEEIIFKLAQAASLPGFYTLVAKYRGREDTLSPDERIFNFFRNIREKPANVQFILRRLEAPSPRPATYTTRPSATGHQQTILHRSGNRHTPGAPPMASGDGSKPALGTCESRAGSASWNPARTPPPPQQQQQQLVSPPKHILHRALTNDSGLTRADLAQTRPARFDNELDEYRQLEDQLAYQEQEVELNRIHLLRLDKEIAELEQTSTRFPAGPDNPTAGFAVGPAAELAQLAATPWPQLLETNRTRQRDLLHERERYQQAVERVTAQLDKAREEAAQLELRVGQELSALLASLEAANTNRRQLLRSLSPPAAYPRPSPSTTADGVAI